MSFGIKAEKSYHGLYYKNMSKKKVLGCPLFHVSSFCQKKQFLCVYFSMQILGSSNCYEQFINRFMTPIYNVIWPSWTNSLICLANQLCIGILAKTTIVYSLLFHWLFSYHFLIKVRKLRSHKMCVLILFAPAIWEIFSQFFLKFKTKFSKNWE